MDFTRSSHSPIFPNNSAGQTGQFSVPNNFLAAIMSGLQAKAEESHRNSAAPLCPKSSISSAEIRPPIHLPPRPLRRDEPLGAGLELNGPPEPPHALARSHLVAPPSSSVSGLLPASRASAPLGLDPPASGVASPPFSVAGSVAVRSTRLHPSPQASMLDRRLSEHPLTTGPLGTGSPQVGDPSQTGHGRLPPLDGDSPRARSSSACLAFPLQSDVQPPPGVDHSFPLSRPTRSTSSPARSAAFSCVAAHASRSAVMELTDQQSTPGQPTYSGQTFLSSRNSGTVQNLSDSVPLLGLSPPSSLCQASTPQSPPATAPDKSMT